MQMSFPFADDVVNAFFIISGFVIFLTLEKTKSAFDFIVSRFSRLFPVYWFSVLTMGILFYIFKIAPEWHRFSWKNWLINLSMLEYFVKVPYIDGVYWTLSVELVFYAFMLALYATRLLKYINLFMSLLVVIAAGIHTFAMVSLIPTRIVVFLNKTVMFEYVSWFALGVSFYQLYRDKKYNRGSLALGLVAFAGVLFMASSYQRYLNLGVVLLFLLFLFAPVPVMLRRPLVYLGVISYPLYLTHQAVGYLAIKGIHKLGGSVNFSILMAFPIIILFSGMVTRFIEKPSMYGIRQWYKSFQKRLDAARAVDKITPASP